MGIFAGLETILGSPSLLAWILAAATLGMVVGAIPGLTASAAIAMLLPVTFYMDPLAALAFLYVIGKSGRYGGSIAAILFNTPGTAASVATQIDGYPLAQRGLASKAMRVATLASVTGDFIGEIILIVGIGFVAALALRLGPPELFAIYLAALVVIGSVIGQSVPRGLASAGLGVLISMVGSDPITATERFTFGQYQLVGGIELVPLIIGVFVIAEVLSQYEGRNRPVAFATPEGTPPSAADHHLNWQELRACAPHMVRSSFIGAFIGMLPGLGSAIAAFVAYAEGKRRAYNPEAWGHGAIEGIAAPEAANNAVSGPSMAPLLTLGIPGSTIGAILVGVFLIHGIQIGPTLFLTSAPLMYSLFAAGLVGIVFYGFIGYFGAAALGRVVARIPVRVLYPLVLMTAVLSAYASRGSLFDVWVALVAGTSAWLLRKFAFNPAAFIISFVLAAPMEEAFRQALRLSEAGPMIFVERPIALAFLLLAFATVGLRLRRSARGAAPSMLENKNAN